MDELRNVLIRIFQNHLTACVIVTILLVAGLIFIVWWSSAMYFKLKSRPCDEHGKRLDDFQGKASQINESLVEVRTSIGYIKDRVDNILDNKASGIIYSKRNSPLKITPKGDKLVERLGMNNMIDSNWDRITNYLKGKLESNNPYDIEKFITEHIVVYPLEFIKEEELDKIKRVAYYEGLPLMEYLTVLVIIIRERYFKENNIDIDEINENELKNQKVEECYG